MIEIYTDGACKGNPGPGGWAYIVVEPSGRTYELSGGEEGTTNNRMELTAAIMAIKSLDHISEAIIYTDSQWLANCGNGWWNRKSNLDLWMQYDNASRLMKVRFIWVKGHDGHAMNERVDKLASAAANAVANGITTSKTVQSITALETELNALVNAIGEVYATALPTAPYDPAQSARMVLRLGTELVTALDKLVRVGAVVESCERRDMRWLPTVKERRWAKRLVEGIAADLRAALADEGEATP